MIVVFSGLPGSGKSLKLADTLLNVLARNRRIYEKNVKLYQKGKLDFLPPRRILWTNLKFTQKV